MATPSSKSTTTSTSTTFKVSQNVTVDIGTTSATTISGNRSKRRTLARWLLVVVVLMAVIAISNTLLEIDFLKAMDVVSFSTSSTVMHPQQQHQQSNDASDTFLPTSNSDLAIGISTSHNNNNNANRWASKVKKKDKDELVPWKVIWLTSFPNSGTTFTLKYVQSATNTTTATNYGASEQICCENSIPIDDSYEEGPYWRRPFDPKPSGTNLVLTKTHCGSDDVSTFSMQYQIEPECRLSNKKMGNATSSTGKVIHGHYSLDVVAKAVHLIRNPFDNIVARMHYRQRMLLASHDKATQALGLKFDSTYDGFQSWCKHVDRHVIQHHKRIWFSEFPKRKQHWNDLFRPVPCFTEFVRWVRWHQHIFDMLRQQQLPALNLYYENYTTHFDETVGELLNFIEQEPHADAKPISFVPGKTYPEFYSPAQVVAIQRLIQTLASEPVWKLIQHYFDP